MIETATVENKVVAFPANRVHRLGPANPQAAAFLSKVLPEFNQQTGLDYMKVREVLHGDRRGFMQFIQEAVDRDMSPISFVSFVVSSNGLMTASEYHSKDEVTAYNEAKVAILEFINDIDDGWKRDLNGSVSRLIESADGTPLGKAFLSPIFHASTREVGFAIQVYDRDMSRSTEEDYMSKPEPSQRFAGYDIEDAYLPFEDYALNHQNEKVAYLR